MERSREESHLSEGETGVERGGRKENEAQRAGGGTLERVDCVRCVLLCRINYERRKAAIKPTETRGDDLANVFARTRLLRLNDNGIPLAR